MNEVVLTKVFLLKVLIVDHDQIGLQEAIEELMNGRFANRCISPQVIASREAEVEWSDEHPLNYLDQVAEEAKKLFPVF